MLAQGASLSSTDVFVLKRAFTMMQFLAKGDGLGPDERKEVRESTAELYDVISRHDGWPRRDRRRKVTDEFVALLGSECDT